MMLGTLIGGSIGLTYGAIGIFFGGPAADRAIYDKGHSLAFGMATYLVVLLFWPLVAAAQLTRRVFP
jgi:hypothetical protein